MSLTVQLQSFFVSFLYGIFFALCFNLSYKYLFIKKKIAKVILNFLFNLNMCLFYFLILKKINYGVLHFYFFVLLYLGFLLGNKLTKKLRKQV